MQLEGKMILKVSQLNDDIKDKGALLKRNGEMLKLREATIDTMEKNYKKVNGQNEKLIALLYEKNELITLDRDATKLDMERCKTKLEEATSRHAKELETVRKEQQAPIETEGQIVDKEKESDTSSVLSQEIKKEPTILDYIMERAKEKQR